MIVREATDKDIPPALRLYEKMWDQLGIPSTLDLARLKQLRSSGLRTIVLYDTDQLPASLSAWPIKTDHGAGYRIVLFAADQDRPDKLKLLDAISLYACNVAMSEGRPVVVSHSKKDVPGPAYGRDHVGMIAEDWGNEYYQVGDAQAIISAILERQPEWQLP